MVYWYKGSESKNLAAEKITFDFVCRTVELRERSALTLGIRV